MKLAFLELSAAERGLYFQQAAARRNLSPVILGSKDTHCKLPGCEGHALQTSGVRRTCIANFRGAKGAKDTHCKLPGCEDCLYYHISQTGTT